jgi:hypothetical protein
LTRFRQRIGEKGVQRIFKTTVSMAIDYEFVSYKSLEKVIVDTTVIEKTFLILQMPNSTIKLEKEL